MLLLIRSSNLMLRIHFSSHPQLPFPIVSRKRHLDGALHTNFLDGLSRNEEGLEFSPYVISFPLMAKRKKAHYCNHIAYNRENITNL